MKHEARHQAVFDEFDRLGVGEFMEIVVDHEPKLLRRQMEQIFSGGFAWSGAPQGGLFAVRIQKTAKAPRGEVSGGGCCGVCGGED